MTFNANIPQATDLMSASQSQIQTNFSQSNTAFGIDHTAFDVVSNQGKHKKVSYLAPIADPATGVGEGISYTKTVVALTELFYRKASNGQVVPISCLRAFGRFVPQVGPTITDSFNVGSVVRNSTGNYTINFSTALPSTSYSIVATGGMSTNFVTGCIIGTANYLVGSFTILLRSMTAISGVDDGLPISFWVFQTGN